MIIEDGRGWDVEIGVVTWPRNFLTVSMANDYVEKVRNSKIAKRGMIPKLFVVPVTLTIDM